MANRLPNSKHGEGAGGPMQTANNPNSPSFDPASRLTGTDRKIVQLLGLPAGDLDDGDRQFIMGVYGGDRLTRRQHCRVSAIHAKHFTSGEEVPDGE